tara:strand:+ start:801 stop:1952 length:1152 start_codon:yes stop_codon:yes gene_type:complete
MKFKITLLITTILILVSCGDDENHDHEHNLKVPETYFFERNGMTSVSYTGQTTRLNQSDELYSALNDNSFTLSDLNKMFQGENGSSAGFSDEKLNGTSKIIGSKTSASSLRGNALTKAQFVQLLTDYTEKIIPNWAADASIGNAGQYGKYHFTENGHEIDQLFFKGLIGAFCLDQIINNYIHPNQLDSSTKVEDNNNEILSGDKNYTDMEHKWDEGFGYLYGQVNDVTLNFGLPDSEESSGNLLMKYFIKADENYHPGIAEKVYKAFKRGRAAIVAKNYIEREAQAKIIKQELSKVIGQYAVHYLESAYTKISSGSDRRESFHGLSEGYGFVLSLQFTNNGEDEPYFTKEEVDTFLGQLNNFYTIEPSVILNMHDDIKSRFDL